jgi:hypothetical protein
MLQIPPTIMHSGSTHRVETAARSQNVEGILPINISFMSLLDFYS